MYPQGAAMTQVASKDFFISYNKADRAWAEWIAWQLEAEGYSTILQAWDFRPGSNFILQMDIAAKAAKRTIAILSPNYFDALYTQPEWAAALVQDPTGQEGKVLPVRIRECTPSGLLASLVYIDLVGLNRLAAQNTLLAGVHRSRARPSAEPSFPGSTSLEAPQAPRFPGNWPEIWNVPYHRNPFFTGREAILEQLHDHFSQAATTALIQPPAITGLGGIGKTQIAIEYAHRHRGEYQYVLWVNATESVTLTGGFVQIAQVVQLPLKEEQDQNKVVEAVKQWLANHDGWLFILDNADDLNLASEFLPTMGRGHMLLTTRDAATGSLANFEVDKMEKRESMELLLQRAKILPTHAPLSQASEADQTTASTIVEEMDGLPLAIDQAGAYIEGTQCSLAAYLKAYQKRQNELLRQRDTVSKDHPDAVATTWSLNFEQVEQQSPIAADLLRFLAFLAPEAIPEELIVNGAPELGEQLEAIAADETRLDEAIRILRRFSLVQRNSEKHALFIHRLVQAVLKANMTDETQCQWAERTVRAVNLAFPGVEVATWPQCERLLPHALVCAKLINEYALALPEAARLLNQTGHYLNDHAQYEQAKPLLERALAIHEQVLGSNHPDTASSLNNLAVLYYSQGDYERAKPLLARTLAIDEQVLGSNHPHTAASLNNLAELYRSQGDYEQAKPLYERALAIAEQVLGPKHPDTATSLNNLALLYDHQGDYEQAKPLYKRALAIREQALGSNHPDTADSLNNLAELYRSQGDYERAKPLLERALAIREQVLGPNHPDTADSLNNLAVLYYSQGDYEQAKSLLARALAIRE
jgi:tetratricopeptide (TPR) repeat protein